MQDESSKLKKKKRKINKSSYSVNLSQERASYFFFIGLLIIAIFGCVASGAPRQGFYGILFVLIGILVALFPPAFITPRWLNFGVILLFVSLSTSLLPRSFAGSQSWRTNLESLGLDTGNLISPHPAATIESLIIVGSVIIIGLCSLGHRVSREKFLKIGTLYFIFVACYAGISILFAHFELEWAWDPNDEFGFFANRNHMATLMVMGSLVGVGSLFIYLKKKNWTGFFITLPAMSVICWAILGYSISRAGLILFISFQIIWFVFVVKKNLNYKLVTSFLVLFCLTVILFLLSDTSLEGRFQNLLEKKESSLNEINNNKKSYYNSVLGTRKYIHADTYKMIQSEPWTGTGLGTFEFIFPIYQKKSNVSSGFVANSKILHPESNWLDITSEAGLLSTLVVLIIITKLLVLTLLRNRKSRSWLLCLSCILSIICVLLHGIVDVPGQKIGIIISGIFLIAISSKPNYGHDRDSPKYVTFTYQLLAVGIFSLGLTLVYSQWFTSKSIIFSDVQTRINKIQSLYNTSIDFAKENKIDSQKEYLMSAIDLTENAIKRSPLDSDLHFIRGKLYSLLEGNDEKMKSSFKIESTLDPNWVKLPLRQSQVLLFIDIKETKRLWINALERANNISDKYFKSNWNKIVDQAKLHPIHIRDVYEIIMSKDDSHYIKEWMNFSGSKNLNIQMPKILESNLLGDETKKDILHHWEKISPNDYNKYLEFNLEN